MKGLLIKDFYQLWRYYKIFYLVAIVMEAASIWIPGNLFVVIYPFFMIGMIPFNLLSMDENSRWEVFCGSLPCTRKQVVTGKYLLGMTTVLPTLALVVLCQSLGMSLNGGSIRWDELGGIVAVCLVAMLLFPSISLPLSFKFGTTKGRVVQMILIGAFCGGIAIFALAVEDRPMLPAEAGTAAILLIMVMVYLLSWCLSIRFYEKRDLG